MMNRYMSEIETNKDWIDRIAEAARLCLTEEERARFGADVCAELSDLSETVFETTFDGWQERAVGLDALRRDCVGDCLKREDLLAQSAFHDESCFLVPKVLGSEEAMS